VKLITAYIQGETYNFLLPVADCDLAELLKSRYLSSGFQTHDDVFASLWGLSSAIDTVHDYFAEEFNLKQIGCHYDIKPTNILCFNGKFVLSDFGLSRLRKEDDGSRSLFKQGEGCYLAPECEPSSQDFKPGRIGRASDIWSFGCVLAELLAYLSAKPGEGPEMVSKFYNARKINLGPFICYHFHGNNCVNPTVIDFLDNLITGPSVTERLRSLAYLVKDILQHDPKKRPKAQMITLRLFHLAQRRVFKAMCSTLESRYSSLGLELEIELQRLKIWADATGLSSVSEQIQEPAWLAKPHSFEEYQDVQDYVGKCFVEINFIAGYLDENSKPANRLSYRLQRLQDHLWDMLPTSVRQNMLTRLEDAILDTGDTSRLQEVHNSIALGDENTNNDIGDSAPKRFNYRRAAYLSTMKDIASAMAQPMRADRNLSMDKSSLRMPFTQFHHNWIATDGNSGQRFLIESMRYGEAWVSRVNQLLDRVNGIASLRSQNVIKDAFPVLKCKGYYHDAARFEFGIVYDLPTLTKNTDPVNLVQLINLTQPRNSQPSLTEKFKLASTLVSYVLDFHRSNWLHKNISAFTIICFPEVFPSQAASLSFPYFIGFSHSRLNDENEYSNLSGPENDYQHPVYLQNSKYPDSQNPIMRFRQEFDYYSVGLVLMEIAFWKPLEKIAKSIVGSPEELLEQLLRTYIPLVKTYMGNTYGEAVRSCLESYSDENRTPEDVRKRFDTEVVVPISGVSL
jgi:serine/threonine protein kinase